MKNSKILNFGIIYFHGKSGNEISLKINDDIIASTYCAVSIL